MSKHDKDADRIADRIGNGHGYDDHIHEFSEARFGDPLPVASREQYRDHVADTLKDPETKGFQTADGRDQFYNARTNTFVGSDPSAEDHGTTFRPKKGEAHYERLKEKDADFRSRNGLPAQPSAESGGYGALQDEKQTRSEDAATSASSQMDAHWPPPPPPPPPAEGETPSEERPRGRSR